jgi:carbon storage regulator CsrA
VLVLTRKNHEVVQIGDGITITVLATNGNTVRLGVNAPPDVEVLREELVLRRQQAAPNRLLIVEDCPEDRVAYRRFLSERAGVPWIFAEADNGEAGLALCAAQRPDCVLLDYLLPDLDGIEFLDRLRRQQDRRDIPVIMVTGNVTPDLTSQALRRGAKQFLCKIDLSRELLQQAVREALRGARAN